MLRNSASGWGAGAKTLHWLLFVLIAIEVPIGYLMAYTFGPSLKYSEMKPLGELLGQIHHTNGFMILTLVVIRIFWRANHAGPDLPADIGRFQRALAHLTQGLLYTALLMVPLSGWAALSVLADSPEFGKTHIWFFTNDGLIPRLPYPAPLHWKDPSGYSKFGPFHITLVYIGCGLLALHIVGALWHHLIRRDGVFLKMWPGAGAQPPTS